MKLGPCVAVFLILLAPAAMLYTLWIDPLSAGEDDVGYYHPLRVMVGQAVARGEWPIQNPLEATGVPLMADPQSAVLHPPTWLFAVLAPRLAYSLSLFGAFWLAGLGAWLYLRRLGLVTAAAAFGAGAFMFSGFMVGHRVHLSVIQTACMLPWGLWCVERMRRGRQETAGPGLAVAFVAMVPVGFMAITAGHWPTLIHVLIIWTAYLLLRARPLAPAIGVAALALALAGALAWPQIDATMQWMAQATRQKIGYAMAGENSFYPASGILAFFPFFYGCRTPNLYPQAWWGPWHLCETLGYVGLVTLVLAAGGIWKLYPGDFWRQVGVRRVIGWVRRRNVEQAAASRRSVEQARPLNVEAASSPLSDATETSRLLVRTWTWMLIGAGIWMLGYYLPTYRLIHMLPVLGVVRCPARMLLAVDMGLATLAAVVIHVLVVRSRQVGQAGQGPGLARAIRRLATIYLPIVMGGWLVLVAGSALLVRWLFPGGIPGMQFWSGGPSEAFAALRPTNPAILIPLAMLALTVLMLPAWLRQPGRQAGWLIALLAVDLFLVARFVDVPAELRPDRGPSPAAIFLAGRPQIPGSFRVWGLADSYHDRSRELLLPKACEAMDISTIANYGPLQSPHHAHLLGLRIFGTTDDWPNLLRKNYLLSLYNVRYLLAADKKFRDVIESVRIPDQPPPPDGPELLGPAWQPENAEFVDGVLRLRTSFMWRWSMAWQGVKLQPGQVYRLSLEARSQASGAGNFVRAEFFRKGPGWDYFTQDDLGLSVHPEHLGPQWRRFEWYFPAPAEGPAGSDDFIRLFTMSERTIEARSVSARSSGYPAPLDLAGRLKPGEAVYKDLQPQGLRPVHPGDEPVHVYENRLCLGELPRIAPTAQNVEALRWLPAGYRGLPPTPDLSVRIQRGPDQAVRTVMLPAMAAYAVLAAGALALGLRRRRGG